MADAAVNATNQGFASLTAFLRKDNAKDSQERRTSQKMIQSGDTRVTLWVRRTAIAVENIERMFKAFLVDAEVRQNKMMEALIEASRSGAGGSGKGPGQAADDPKFDWSKMMKSKWFAPIMVGLMAWMKDIFTSPAWADKLGLEAFSAKLGQLLGGAQKGGWLNMMLNAGKWALAGAALGVKGGFMGALAGGILGAIFGGILGWLGAEKIAKALDPIIKGFMRIFGLQTETTQADVQKAVEEKSAANKKLKASAKKLKAIKEEIKLIEAAGDLIPNEMLLKRSNAQKEYNKLQKEFIDAHNNSEQLQLDIYRNKKIALTDELTTLEREEQRWTAAKWVRSAARKAAKSGIDSPGWGGTKEEYQNKLAELENEQAIGEKMSKERKAKMDKLREPIFLAEQAYKKYYEQMQASPYFKESAVQTAEDMVNATAEAFRKVITNFTSIWEGMSQEQIISAFSSWEKTKAANEVFLKGYEDTVKRTSETYMKIVNKRLDGMAEEAAKDGDDFDRAAAKKRILDTHASKEHPGQYGKKFDKPAWDARLATPALAAARAQQNLKRFERGQSEDEQMRVYFKQHSKWLTDNKKAPITYEEFIKQINELQLKVDSILEKSSATLPALEKKIAFAEALGKNALEKTAGGSINVGGSQSSTVHQNLTKVAAAGAAAPITWGHQNAATDKATRALMAIG